MKGKQPKKVKATEKTNRLIARMILSIGLSLTIANGVACGIIHPKFSDTKDDFRYAKNNKDAYLDAYEQTDEFKTTYNTDVAELNDRLIAREIDAHTYESELEKLNDNTYTEKVLVENANEQTQAEFNEINQKYLTANDEWDKLVFPCVLSSYFSAVFPAFTLINYNVWVPKKKHDEDVADEKIDAKHIPQIDPEVMKMVMQIKDTPYHPINASENQICKNMLKNVTHNDDTQQNCGYSHLIHTEEEIQENQNTLNK